VCCSTACLLHTGSSTEVELAAGRVHVCHVHPSAASAAWQCHELDCSTKHQCPSEHHSARYPLQGALSMDDLHLWWSHLDEISAPQSIQVWFSSVQQSELVCSTFYKSVRFFRLVCQYDLPPATGQVLMACPGLIGAPDVEAVHPSLHHLQSKGERHLATPLARFGMSGSTLPTKQPLAASPAGQRSTALPPTATAPSTTCPPG
jgi:hypothetical protein